MEATLYDDSGARDIAGLKKRMTLDLGPPVTKRQLATPVLLTSPDLNMLKLASPELERLIISQSGLVTPTPTRPDDIYTFIPRPVETIKEEVQEVPTSPEHHAPIVMEDQERLKLERKRLRNRLAATKCRRKKLEKISQLEEKVAHLKEENATLNGKVASLRESVEYLRRQIIEHINCGCDLQLTPELV